MEEQERLEKEAQKIKDELRQLHMSLALGQIDDEIIIKEKRKQLFKILTSLELCKINKEENNPKRR